MPYLIAALAALAIAVCVWFATRQARRHRRLLYARKEFDLQRADLQKLFFEASANSGKPRGLAWKTCDFHDAALFAVDRANGELHALVGVTISFEAIEGGGMEEVEAVGNLRCATAVFTTQNGQWTTDGRTVFNLEPHETLERFGESLEPFSTD